MKFGLRYCNTGRYVDPARAVELAQAGEAAGFESLWTIEHTVLPASYKSAYPYSEDGKIAEGNSEIALPDPLIWLSFVASATSTINLGTAVVILPQHNPVVLAKQVGTLDHMSNGRIILGIGVGWLKEEFDALGVPFAARGKRADEYVAAMRELWSSSAPTFDGEFVSFKEVHCLPQPVNKDVPIVVGGDSTYAARRAGRLGNGYFPARGAPTEYFDLARKTAEEHGRDPDAIEFTVSMPDDPSELPALAKLGVSRVVVPVSPTAGLPAQVKSPEDALTWRDTIDRYRDL
jgi:probable F420-dependent oxidoreductase